MSTEEQNSFEFLAENSADVICRAGADMVLRYASRSAFQVLGWKPEEMVGKKTHELVLAEDAALFASALNPSAGSPVTVRMKKKDGMIVWIEIKHRVVLDSATGLLSEAIILMRDVTERQTLHEKISRLSLIDPLTGLSTHDAFDEALEREWNRALREGSLISLLLLDFHQFKPPHGRHSQIAADSRLVKAAPAVIDALRATDFAARYGEEEIAVILPATGPGGAAKVAAKLRKAILDLRLPYPEIEAGEGWVAVSIGSASVLARPGATSKMPELLLLTARSSLRNAKDRDIRIS